MSLIISILSSAILDYINGNNICASALVGLNIPPEEEERHVVTDFAELDDDIVSAIFQLVCNTVFNQPFEQNQLFLYLKWAILSGKQNYIRSLDIRDSFTRFVLTQKTSIAENLLHILAIIEIARNKEDIVGKSARELYDMHFEIYHTLTLIDHHMDFSKYIEPSVSNQPYLHVFLLRYFTMHSISEEDIESMKCLDARPGGIFDVCRGIRCQAFNTLKNMYDQSSCQSSRQSSRQSNSDLSYQSRYQSNRDLSYQSSKCSLLEAIPTREIVPVFIGTKISQREKKAAAALLKTSDKIAKDK